MAILSVVGIGIPYLLYAISILPSVDWPPFEYEYLLFVFFILYILVGFVSWDLIRVRWRRKNQVYDGPIDKEVVDKSWATAMGIFLAAILLLAVISFNEIYALFNGGVYPLF